MKFWFVRHGKDNENYRGGWSNIDLIDEGILQAEKLAKYLQEKQTEYKINKIISSDLLRAKHTAEIINEKLQLNIEYFEDWREMNNGDLAGLENSVAEKKYKGIYFYTLRMDEKYPNGESPDMFFERVKIAFENLLKYSLETDNILIVTHSGVINIIYHIINKKEWTNKEKVYSFPFSYCDINLVEKDNDKLDICKICYP